MFLLLLLPLVLLFITTVFFAFTMGHIICAGGGLESNDDIFITLLGVTLVMMHTCKVWFDFLDQSNKRTEVDLILVWLVDYVCIH